MDSAPIFGWCLKISLRLTDSGFCWLLELCFFFFFLELTESCYSYSRVSSAL